MFCNRCGTPLRAGDRFCPRCGATVDPNRSVRTAEGQPGWSGRQDEPPRRSRAVGIVIAMLVMVAVLLAAAVWSQWDALSGLFDPMPPASSSSGRPGAERVAEEHPETDAVGTPWIDPDPEQTEQDMARALLGDAAQGALELLYGDEAISRAEAKQTFCNLEAAGYQSALDKAMDVNGTTIGALSRWDGYAMSRPMMAGNCGYVAVLFYSVEDGPLPRSFETRTEYLCLLWTGSTWRVDATDQTKQLWAALFADQRASLSLRMAELSGRPAIRFGTDTRIIRPVIPGTYDAMPTEVCLEADGSAVVEFWAFNGTDAPLDAGTLAEVSLREDDGSVYFALYDTAIEPLHLEPGEGQLVTLTVPPDEITADLRRIRNVTCSVWFSY